MKVLAFMNWIAFGIGAALTLMYAVVCLMMWPYPELVAKAGGGFDQILRITAVLALFTVIAAWATWQLQQRRRGLWAGQVLLLLAGLGTGLFALLTR